MNFPQSKSAFLQVLSGEVRETPPVWFMRQAGRYLPEYRDVRAKAGSFLDLCFSPDLASEVTLQPIRRFDFDAAILFADILLIPMALGQHLSFVEGEGPRLDPPVGPADIDRFRERDISQTLAPVYETVRKTRAALAPDKALIGFAGAPWTVGVYMLAGGPSRDPVALRAIAYENPAFIDALIEILVDKTVEYLVAQVAAGADALQIFDTWAGGLPEDLLRRFSLEPMTEIARRVKAICPGTPVMVFPRGVGAMVAEYAASDVYDAVSIDASTSWDWARKTLSPHAVVQGGLDPLLTVAGGETMEKAARALISTFEGTPYIFNLGHGLTPQTPPENVARLVEIAREGRR